MNGEGTVPEPPNYVADGAGSEPALASEISRRVGAILDAVEREAARLREEARTDAARYMEDARRRADALVVERRRRIAEVSDDLMAKSEAVVARLDDAAPVREGFEHLVRALGDAAERLSSEVEAEPSGFAVPPYEHGYAAPEPSYAPAAHPSPAQQPPPVTPPPGAAPAPRAAWRELDDVRVVANQMATTGSTRAEVRDHLEHALGVVDPDRALDEIFGPDSSEEVRVPWTGGRG